jgi:[acyl-carrier-protein] S-malonyltransferase
VAAGALSLDDGIELVCLRGRLMAEADPEAKGGMAAMLKLNLADVEAIVEESSAATGLEIVVANYNTPGQFVISGSKQAIGDAVERAKARKGRGIPLPVSGAFHSPLMTGAAKEMEKALAKVTFSRPRFAVYCNVTGQAAAEADVLHECMRRQMISGVRWIDTINNQWKDGVRRWIELGPRGVLTKMLAQNLADAAGDERVWQGESISTIEAAEAFV